MRGRPLCKLSKNVSISAIGRKELCVGVGLTWFVAWESAGENAGGQ